MQIASVGISNGNFNFSYAQMVNSLNQPEGSFAGGLRLSINGKGFGENTRVKICGIECPKTSYNYSTLICIVCDVRLTFKLFLFNF